MVGDGVFRQCVTALWTLIESLRDSADEHTDAALSAALDAVHEARGDENYLLLHEVGGALHVSGRMVPMSVDVFAAASGLATLFREQGVGEVLFDRSVDGEALLGWAHAQARGVHETTSGIYSKPRTGEEAAVPLSHSEAAGDAPDSRLRSMFLQHHLIVAFGASSWVPPHQAKVAIGAVVDRMLGLAGGMEPLMLLQRDEALLYRSLHVAVFAVVFGRVFGWPEHRLQDLGGAALLHDIGSTLPGEPGPAALAWLLERGSDEFWLHSAVVARTWRRDHGSSLADLGPDDSLAAVMVRLAAIVESLSCTADSLDDVENELVAASTRGEIPHELVDVAVRTLGQWWASAVPGPKTSYSARGE